MSWTYKRARAGAWPSREGDELSREVWEGGRERESFAEKACRRISPGLCRAKARSSSCAVVLQANRAGGPHREKRVGTCGAKGRTLSNVSTRLD